MVLGAIKEVIVTGLERPRSERARRGEHALLCGEVGGQGGEDNQGRQGDHGGPRDAPGSPVLSNVVPIEPVLGAIEQGGGDVDRPVRRRDPHLEGLPGVAQVCRSHVAVQVAVEALPVQAGGGLLLQLVVEAGQRGDVEVGVPADGGPHVVVSDVDGQQAERRHVARVARHEHAGEAEHVDQPAQQERPGAAEGRHREVAHVQPALDGDLPQRIGLVPRGYLQDALGAAFDIESHRRSVSHMRLRKPCICSPASPR